MADVNWDQYRCNLCLMVGLSVSAVISALVGWILIRLGLPVALAVVIFFVVWGALGFLVDNYCHRAAAAHGPADHAAPAEEAQDVAEDAAEDAAAAAEAAEAERRATEEAARRADEERAAAETADAARRAAEDAARQAEEAKAAEEAKRAEEAEAAEAERLAEEARAEEARAEAARAEAALAEQERAAQADTDSGAEAETAGQGARPETLAGPRDGGADDLKKIKGIGPKLEQVCNQMGFYHFDQIAAWTDDEIAWVDSNLEGFKGRVTRDEWVAQARLLASGGETEFSKRVDDGDVPSSQ